MATRPDLTLPARAPSVARFHNQPMRLRPAALYTLISFTDAELAELQEACEQETSPAHPGVNIRVAPRPSFVNENLRAVFEYHLQLGTGNIYDPVYFLVAVDRDWRYKGVLIVTLDDDDLNCKVDKFFSLAPDAGLTIVNLQISNIDWGDAKEGALDENDDDNNNNDDEDGDSGGSDHGEDKKGPPPSGSFCGVYVVEGADANDIQFKLTPGANTRKDDRSNWPVLLQGTLSPSLNLLEQVFTLHPARCRRNKWLEKDLFFLADTNDSDENGILLCQLSERRTQRTPLNAVIALQETYLGIRNGSRPWLNHTPWFLVFYNSFDKKFPMQRLRKHGGIVSTPLQKVYKVDEAIHWFPNQCRQKRFVHNLNKQYFVCVPADWEAGVWLVHVDWDCNLSRSDEEMLALDLSHKTTAFRCPADDAYIMLKAILEGKQTWPASTEVEHFTTGQEEKETTHLPPDRTLHKYRTKSGLDITSCMPEGSDFVGQTTWVGGANHADGGFDEIVKQLL